MIEIENKNEVFTTLKNFLDEEIQNDTDTSKITVFPIPCGVGKSEYVKYAIADALQNRRGLIIVTDTIDRLTNYVTEVQEESLAKYIKNNLHRISVLTGDNFADERKKITYKPVVLMSTQRYFGLTKTEIKKFIHGGNFERSRIMFDEKVYLLESRRITVETLNQIDTALDEGLDNTVDRNEKQWLLGQYRILSQALKQRLEENEKLNTDIKTYKREGYFDAKGLTVSEDDERFFALIEKYIPYLKRYPDVYKDIRAIKKLFVEGAITSQKIKNKTDKDYGNYFTVVLNNFDRLINIDAKVFVLDGTAELSPEYRLNCVRMVDCSRFDRDLSNLTINIVDLNTGKERLTKGDGKTKHLLNQITGYIKALPYSIDTLFTYKNIENDFREHFENVNHFGNIKGTNQYRNENNICQVGLNRYPELIYLLYANEIGRFNDTDKSIIKRIYGKEFIDRIRCQFILADIEQNIFRCKIRNVDNNKKCIYTLIFNIRESTYIFENYSPLIDMLKKRFEKYGATVNFVETPMEFRLLKTKERKQDTYAKKILNWLAVKGNGYIFKVSEMKAELEITDKQFEKIKEKNIAIKVLFDRMRTDKRGYYKV